MRQAPNNQIHTPINIQKIFIIILCLALILAAYSITYNGSFRIDDEHILAARSQSLALRGEFSEPQVYGNERLQTLQDLGESAVQIEPLQAIVSAPLYRFAVEFGAGGGQAIMLLSIYLTVLTAASIGLSIYFMGFSNKTVAWCMLLFGLGSMAWPYALTYFRDVLTMFMSSLVFLGWCIWSKSQGKLKIIAAICMGLGILGAIASKNTGILLIPTFMIAIAFYCYKTNEFGKKKIISAGMISISILILLWLWSLIEFRGPLARFDLRYYAQTIRIVLLNLDLNSALAAVGPFVSPVRSIFLYSPVLILSIASIPRWRRRYWFVLPVILYTLFLAISQALFYGERWGGVLFWGLRYMLPALPGLVILSAATVECLLSEDRKWYRFGLPVILGLGILIQLAGSVVDWREINSYWVSRSLDPFQSTSNWDPRFLPIPFHLISLLYPSRWAISLRFSLIEHAFAIIAIVLIALGVLIYLLADLLVEKRSIDRKIWFRTGIVFSVLAFLLPVVVFLSAQSDSRWGGGFPGFESSLDFLESKTESDDVVVVDSYGTRLWFFAMNHWSTSQQWYSLPYKLPGSSEEELLQESEIPEIYEDLFGFLERERNTLWYLSSTESPPEKVFIDLGYLESKFVLLGQWDFQGEPSVRIYKFKPRE